MLTGSWFNESELLVMMASDAAPLPSAVYAVSVDIVNTICLPVSGVLHNDQSLRIGVLFVGGGVVEWAGYLASGVCTSVYYGLRRLGVVDAKKKNEKCVECVFR